MGKMRQSNLLYERIMPAIANDTEMIFNYNFEEGDVLECPMFCICAHDDKTCTLKSISAWRNYTTNDTFIVRVPGDHFYINNEEGRRTICSLVSRIAQQSLGNMYRTIHQDSSKRGRVIFVFSKSRALRNAIRSHANGSSDVNAYICCTVSQDVLSMVPNRATLVVDASMVDALNEKIAATVSMDMDDRDWSLAIIEDTNQLNGKVSHPISRVTLFRDSEASSNVKVSQGTPATIVMTKFDSDLSIFLTALWRFVWAGH